MAPRGELVRVAVGADGPVPGAGRPGRGAWLCPGDVCFERSVRSGALARALRVERDSVVQHQERLRGALEL